MNYRIMLEQQPGEKTALIEDGRAVTYGELLELAATGNVLRSHDLAHAEAGGTDGTEGEAVPSGKQLYRIRRDTILEELTALLACQGSRMVPVILAGDETGDIPDIEVPPEAVMGVATSGTGGRQKILFRTYESWADFFPIQNDIFSMNRNTILFAQGSLAFTGNLNLYLALLSVGGTLVCTKRVHPQYWFSLICQYNLIPTKINALCRATGAPWMGVRQFVTGSQSFGKRETARVKECFPEASVTLYYGSSEASYLTYLRGEDMTEDPRLVGRAFPDVTVWIQNHVFYVESKYGIIGISHPFCTQDLGSMDAEGSFYFDGRADDLLNVNGTKCSAYRIEQAIRSVTGVEQVVVIVQKNGEKDALAACYEAESELEPAVIRKQLKRYLPAPEIPRQFIRLEHLPRTESGKPVRKKLMDGAL